MYLETDPSQDSVDRFGRTLAYVWTASGRLFNLDMIADAALLGAAQFIVKTVSQALQARRDASAVTRGNAAPPGRGN